MGSDESINTYFALVKNVFLKIKKKRSARE